jgi:hypothetical protein
MSCLICAKYVERRHNTEIVYVCLSDRLHNSSHKHAKISKHSACAFSFASLNYYPILKMTKLTSATLQVTISQRTTFVMLYKLTTNIVEKPLSVEHAVDTTESIWIYLALPSFHFQSQEISSLLHNISDLIKLRDSEDVFGCVCICCWTERPAVLRRLVENQ